MSMEAPSRFSSNPLPRQRAGLQRGQLTSPAARQRPVGRQGRSQKAAGTDHRVGVRKRISGRINLPVLRIEFSRDWPEARSVAVPERLAPGRRIGGEERVSEF